MIAHHLPLDMLVDHATGSLPEGLSMVVAAHVALCADCRRQVENLESVGAALLEGIEPADISAGAFERALRRLEEAPPAPLEAPAAGGVAAVLPFPLRRYVDSSARWRRAGWGVEEIALKLREGPHQASLLRIRAGRAMATHRHSGLEYTLVLAGGFTDRGAHYGPGDICLAAGPEHTPVADPDQDCICLAVVDGPIVLTGAIGRLLNPYLRFRARRAAGL